MMEAFLMYLGNASLGMALFYGVYFFLLQNETFYKINRIYLVLGVVLAVTLPLFPMSYAVSVPMDDDPALIVPDSTINTSEDGVASENEGSFNQVGVEKLDFFVNTMVVLFAIYVIGALVLFVRLLWSTGKLFFRIHKNDLLIIDGTKVIEFGAINPFSFFNVVFIDIQKYSAGELSNIVAHEKVHIRQRHWADLMIIELLLVLFWINPVVWLYERSIKQNHEYLADQGVLLAGYSPGQYQALLINQLMGAKVLGFTHNLNFSLNKKRIEMMKKKKSQTIKKLKLLLVLPLAGTLIFAFAERKIVLDEGPGSKFMKPFTEKDSNLMPVRPQADVIKVIGTIVTEDNKPITDAYVFLLDRDKHGVHPYQNTGELLKVAEYTISDENGKYEISFPYDKRSGIVIARVGYYTILYGVRRDAREPYLRTTILKKGVYHLSLPDGRYFAAPQDYRNHELLQNTPPHVLRTNNQTMIIVEGLPKYKNGGSTGLARDIDLHTAKYSNETGEKGKVKVSMLIDENGNASDFEVLASNNKELNQEAIRIMKKLNNWAPGVQESKTIPVPIAAVVSFD